MGRLCAITPFTLLDYPGETACIAWFAGCSLRCVYCHNPEFVRARGDLEDSELIAFLEKRRGLLTSVVFSGGEATGCATLPQLAAQARELGFKTKLDTNGTKPKALARLLDHKLLNYVALDYKCPASRAKELLGTAKYTDALHTSLEMLVESVKDGLTLEVRTTFHADLMTEDDLSSIIHDLDQIGFKGKYTVQNVFSLGEKTLGNIAKPSRQIDPAKIAKPQNFSLSFRNFPNMAST